MSRTADHYREWEDHRNKVVRFEGVNHRIKVNTFIARYPYEEERMSVSLETCNKNSVYYREVKEALGDDWLIDVLELSPESYVSILQQCQKQHAPKQ